MVLLENIFIFGFGWVGSECVFVLGSVNEWMRRKGEDGLGGGVYIGWDRALKGLVGGWE